MSAKERAELIAKIKRTAVLCRGRAETAKLYHGHRHGQSAPAGSHKMN